jgi:hypothetical protein
MAKHISAESDDDDCRTMPRLRELRDDVNLLEQTSAPELPNAVHHAADRPVQDPWPFTFISVIDPGRTVFGVSYYPNDYPPEHWAYKSAADANYFVARCGALYVKLNPTDSRGFRLIVSLEDHPDNWNRPFTREEHNALFLLAVQVKFILLEELGVADVQIIQANNNAHGLARDGSVLLGNAREPYMLHVHVVARDTPGRRFLQHLVLRGPAPGAVFDLRGEADSQRKLPWKVDERVEYREWLRNACAKRDGFVL